MVNDRFNQRGLQQARTASQKSQERDQTFDYMGINELRQHEQGLLNMFESDRQINAYRSHNQKARTGSAFVRLNQEQYLTIFEHKPSFNEKKAFVDLFRRKWKEDKGYCSLFDKRKSARLAKSASID